MPRPRDPNKKTQMSVRVRPDLKEQAIKAAADQDVSLSELVGQALTAHLGDRETA